MDEYSRRFSEGGKVARLIDNIEFRLKDDLPGPKRRRLDERGVKPVEEVTFAELKSYNRDQLRAYCYIYGIPRKKKAEMEQDMARYAAAFHPGDPNYDLSTFENVESSHGPRTFNTPNVPNIPFTRSSIYYQPTMQDTQSAQRMGNFRSYGSLYGPQQSYTSSSFRTDKLGVNFGVTRQTNPYARLPPSVNLHIRKRLQRNTTKSQREHARQAAAKFKMALEGQGPERVPVINNAAAYFHAEDTFQETMFRNEAYERYQRNNKMLLELFERPVHLDSRNMTNNANSENLRNLIYSKISQFAPKDSSTSSQEEQNTFSLKDIYKIDNIKSPEDFWKLKEELENQYDVKFISLPPKVRVIPFRDDKGTEQVSDSRVRILQLR